MCDTASAGAPAMPQSLPPVLRRQDDVVMQCQYLPGRAISAGYTVLVFRKAAAR
jgi:hypothetical protein